MTTERRTDYRVCYPPDLRPYVVVDGFSLPVIDVCERGIRFERRPGMTLPAGTSLDGWLELNDGMGIAVRGTVLRSGILDVVAQLDLGPSFSSIRMERDRLQGQPQ